MGAVELFHSPNVCAVVHIRGVDIVVSAVAGQQHTWHAIDPALDERVRGQTERGLNYLLLAALEDVRVI